jgi:hypothetical protein
MTAMHRTMSGHDHSVRLQGRPSGVLPSSTTRRPPSGAPDELLAQAAPLGGGRTGR